MDERLRVFDRAKESLQMDFVSSKVLIIISYNETKESEYIYNEK